MRRLSSPASAGALFPNLNSDIGTRGYLRTPRCAAAWVNALIRLGGTRADHLVELSSFQAADYPRQPREHPTEPSPWLSCNADSYLPALGHTEPVRLV